MFINVAPRVCTNSCIFVEVKYFERFLYYCVGRELNVMVESRGIRVSKRIVMSDIPEGMTAADIEDQLIELDPPTHRTGPSSHCTGIIIQSPHTVLLYCYSTFILCLYLVLSLCTYLRLRLYFRFFYPPAIALR